MSGTGTNPPAKDPDVGLLKAFGALTDTVQKLVRAVESDSSNTKNQVTALDNRISTIYEKMLTVEKTTGQLVEIVYGAQNHAGLQSEVRAIKDNIDNQFKMLRLELDARIDREQGKNDAAYKELIQKNKDLNDKLERFITEQREYNKAMVSWVWKLLGALGGIIVVLPTAIAAYGKLFANAG